MNAIKSRAPIALKFCLVAIVVASCTEVPTIDQVVIVPKSITAVGTTSLTAVAGSVVANPFQVRVQGGTTQDPQVEPLPNQTVSFTASKGTLSSATATTNANGQAGPASWTAPTSTAGGPATISAGLPNFGSVGSVSFTVTVTPAAAATQTKTASTDNLSAIAGTATASAPEITVVDQYGNGISGVVVTFTVLTGGGTVNGGNTANVTTDANGKAKLTSWVLGPTAGAAGSNNNTVRATTAVLSAQPQVFSATGTVGPPNKIVIAPPGNSQGQTATAGSNVAVAPAVLVTDANNNAVGAGVAVRFAIGVGGGKIINSSNAQVATLDVTTNAQGIASTNGWMVWDLGSNTLIVTTPGVTPAPTPFTITATSVAGAPTQIAVVTETPSSNNQSAPTATNVAVAPGAIVTDENGFVVAGVSVTFTVGATNAGTIKVTAGGADVTTGTVTTDAGGIARLASWKLGPAKGANTLTAALTSNSAVTVTFTATGTAGPPASIAIENANQNNQTTIANTAVTNAPAVVVRDANNVTVDAGVSITFEIVTGGGVVSASGCTGTATSVTVNTDVNGVARLGCWKPGTIGASANTMRAKVTAAPTIFATFTASGTVGPPTTVTFTNQPWSFTRQGFVNRSQGPKVKVSDAGGNGVSGLTVNWSNNSNTNGTVGGTTSSLTNASGEATFTGTLTAAGAIGATMVLRADVATTTLNALSTNVLIVGAPNNTLTQTNAPATTTVNTNVTPLPVFVVRDANNQPVPDVQVTWSYTVNPNSNGTLAAPLTVMPDSLGRTQPAGAWRVSQTAGVNTIQAAMVGTALTASFSTTGVAGTASSIGISSQSATSATVNSTIQASAIVRDQFSNPVSGANVTFATSSAPSGAATNAAVTSATTVATDAFGVALATWRLDTLVRTNTLVATITGSSPAVSVSFTATSTVGTAAKIVKIAGDNQMLWTTDSVFIDPSVRVTDQYNNAVGAGVGVTFSPSAGSGSVLGGSQTTSLTGIATVTRWTIGTGNTSTLNAFLTSNSAVTTSFTATQPCVTPTTYTAGATVNGTLTFTDCQSSNGLDSLTFVDRYRATVASGQTAYVSVTVSSSTFATLAQFHIWPAHYWYEYSGAPGPTTKHLVLGPGTYDIWGTTLQPKITGAYSLTSTSNPPLPSGCGDFLITKGASLASGVHSVDASSCNYVSTGPSQSSTPRASKLYHICTQSSSITGTTIRMGSSSWDPLLEAYDTNDNFVKLATGVSGGAQAVLALDPTPSATCYQIRASHRIASPITQATAGTYSISVDP